jgi:GTP-binding protein Era
VSIVSGKPQTTRSIITAYYEDERGQIFFTDTPGYYQGKAVASYNRVIAQSIKDADVVVYVVDQSRDWGDEDERIWHMVEDCGKPTILVINKADIENHDFSKSYELLVGKHVAKTIKLSASRRTHLNTLIASVLELLPSGERDVSVDHFQTHLLSQTSMEFLAEIVREKIYEYCGAEVPYQVRTLVTSVNENEEKNTLTVKGYIIVNETHYKGMLIGANGRMIAKITKATQKELWVATGKEVTLKLKVIDPEELDNLDL